MFRPVFDVADEVKIYLLAELVCPICIHLE
jgi:hypothetical protein